MIYTSAHPTLNPSKFRHQPFLLAQLLSLLNNISPINHSLHIRIRPLIRHLPTPQLKRLKLLIALLLGLSSTKMHISPTLRRKLNQRLRPRLPQLLIQLQRLVNRLRACITESRWRENDAKNGSVFDCLRGTLRHVGECRVTCVAD